MLFKFLANLSDAEKNGYYYLIDDTGDKDNLLTVLPIKEHSFK